MLPSASSFLCKPFLNASHWVPEEPRDTASATPGLKLNAAGVAGRLSVQDPGSADREDGPSPAGSPAFAGVLHAAKHLQRKCLAPSCKCLPEVAFHSCGKGFAHHLLCLALWSLDFYSLALHYLAHTSFPNTHRECRVPPLFKRTLKPQLLGRKSSLTKLSREPSRPCM